jgi:outer membrane protein TolC
MPMTQRRAFNNYAWSLAIFNLMMASLLLSGCSRQWYRKAADRDANCLIKSRQFDDRWDIPDRAVEPDPTSRLADPNDPDCGPLPPDDPAAHCYMNKPYGSKRRIEYWDRRGTGAMVDAEQWLQYLPYNEEGEVALTKELAVDLALLHSRDFQEQIEQLYLEALSLSQNRFAFNIQWAGGTGASIDLDGAEATPQTLNNPSRLSASRNFAAGGQLVVDLLNSVTYQFGGGQSNFATGNLLFRLTQPLLRNAFRHVRTEGLTQSERSLLYSVRDFARFRRQFYLRIVQQYLNLLSQSQQIRIEEENIRNLDLNLTRAQIQYKQGTISQIEVDQIFQNKQNGRISLISAKQSLQAAQDQFKFELGLPAKVNIKLDESILDPFKLNSDEIEALQTQADDLVKSLLKYIPPIEAPKEFITESYGKLKQLHATAESLQPEVLLEMEQWKARLKKASAAALDDQDQQLELELQADLALRIEEAVKKLETKLEATGKLIAESEKSFTDPTEEKSEIEKPEPEFNSSDPEAPPSPDQAEIAEMLGKLSTENQKTPAVVAFNRLVDTNSELMANISDLFVAQTKIRLFLIDITPVDIDEATAVRIALSNRLDLMNDKARVVDRYRAVEIAADQLESDLNFTASADLRTDPSRDNGIRFDGESSRYSAGLQFDGPLNRFAERNAYRSAQISYQQQRRSYMASEDSIVNEVRGDLRSLTQSRFNFQTTRQQLIAAARQVDFSRGQVQNPPEGSDSSLTRNLLDSLADLRNARNGLISSWLNYEVARIGLFVDLELLLLDEQGRWINADEQLQYDVGSVEALLPQADDLEFEQIDSEEIEFEIDPPDPGLLENVPEELPELKLLDAAKVNGNESSQTIERPERVSRKHSNRRSIYSSDLLRR